MSKNLSTTIFSKIRNVLVKDNIKFDDAFKMFDLDNDNSVNALELYKCFKQMGLDVT